MRAVLLITILLAACSPQQQPDGNDAQPAAEAESVKGPDRTQKGKAAPDVAFVGPDAEATSIAEFKGKPVLLNLWATWCAPCVKELPTLDALAARPGAPAVLTISQDTAPQASVVAFLEKLKVERIEAYHDPKMGLSGALGAEVLPTSVLFDAEGREVWRYVGDLDWSGAEAAKLLAEGGGPTTP